MRTIIIHTWRKSQHGLTIVEVIVTLFVVSLFITAFLQTILTVEAQRTAVIQHSKANDIAYSNLRKVTTRTMLAGQTCTTTGWNLTDSIFGYVVDSEAGYTASLWAYPSNGCGNFNNDPIRIVSTVRYRVNGIGTENTVAHASFIR